MVAISAVGVWLSDDRGATWRYSNSGIVPEYLPEEARDMPDRALRPQRPPRSGARPERLFMQFHGGVYRSDDAGASWIDVGDGTDLPSDFGFPIVVDPADPDSAYVIPLIGAEDRTTPGGSVRVWETRDAGATWAPRGNGLPERDAYLTVLREAFDSAGVRRGPRALLRRDVGRRLRLGRRRRELGAGRGASAARPLGAHGLTSHRAGRAERLTRARMPPRYFPTVVGMSVISPSAIFCSIFFVAAMSALFAFGLNVPSPTPS